jgi:hypothetical protein
MAKKWAAFEGSLALFACSIRVSSVMRMCIYYMAVDFVFCVAAPLLPTVTTAAVALAESALAVISLTSSQVPSAGL